MPDAFANLPDAQDWQLLAATAAGVLPTDAAVPFWHSMHDTSPTSSPALPAGQSMQSVALELGW
jgi:hypothetical protein